MNAKAGDVLDGLFELAVQLALIVGLFFAGMWLWMWLWPDGLLNTQFAAMSFADLLWAGAAVVVWIFALGWIYFLIEPLRALRK